MDMKSPVHHAIGIDLGTAYTCVAVYRAGRVEIIPDRGFPTMPSYVAFTGTTRLVGAEARNQANSNPSNTIFDALRFIGRDFADPEIQACVKRCPFAVVQRDGVVQFEVAYKGATSYITPAEILSMILTRARENAEAHLGFPVDSAVITIPSIFGTRERQVIKDMARVAGLKVWNLIEGPTAAAMHFCMSLQDQRERNLLVYDLGAASFDVTLLTEEEGIFDMKAVSGDSFLGGLDFDWRLVNYCLNELKSNDATRHEIARNPRCLGRLRAACERAKRELSSQQETLLEIDSLHDGIDFRLTVTRSRFEQLCQDLFQSTVEPIQRVLRDASMDKSSIHEVIMAGGSSRIPHVQRIVSEFFNGKAVSKSLNIDEASAFGAATLAAILSGNDHDSPELNKVLLLDITAFSLGIEHPGGVMMSIIRRNTIRPIKSTEVISVDDTGDTSFQVSIFEGESAHTKDNVLLGCIMFPLSAGPPNGQHYIEVTFDLDARDSLHVSVVERHTNHSINTSMPQVGRFPEEEIDRMQASAVKFKADEDAEMSRISERDALELFAHKLHSTFCTFNWKGAPADELIALIDTTIEWLDNNPSVGALEYRAKHNDLQRQLRFFSL